MTVETLFTDRTFDSMLRREAMRSGINFDDYKQTVFTEIISQQLQDADEINRLAWRVAKRQKSAEILNERTLSEYIDFHYRGRTVCTTVN